MIQNVSATCDCEDWECDCDAHLKCANNLVNDSKIVGNTALDNIMECVKRELDDPSEEDDEQEEEDDEEQEEEEEDQDDPY